MHLKQQIYSVLVISASDPFTRSLTGMLETENYEPVQVVKNISAASRELSERSFDFVLINSPLPDDPGIRFAIDTAGSANMVVLLLIRGEFYEEIREKVAGHGVFTLSKPLAKQTCLTALDWMSVIRDRQRRSQEKALTLEEKMQEIRLVNRAKWLLISELKMDEPHAHRYIEKQAMDRCVSKREIAEMLIRTYSAT